MAKGKHSTALFEVIHAGKNAQKSLLSTPRWWFKKREQEQRAAAAPRSGASSDDPTLGRDAVDHHISGAATTRDRTISYAPEPAPARLGGLDVAVDPDRHQITFKVSYTSAIIVTFSVLVAIGLAYLVGQKMNRGPAQALAGQSSEQLRAGPKNPGVIDVGRNSGANAPAIQREPDPAITSRGPDSNPDNVEAPAPAPLGNPGAISQQRVLNLNYVVVQSYPDQKSAEEARDALLKAGIACTIEQKLKGWKPEWFCVVGMQGFQRASGGEYEAYLAKIIDVSNKFALRKRSFKAFQPMAYKWTHAG